MVFLSHTLSRSFSLWIFGCRSVTSYWRVFMKYRFKKDHRVFRYLLDCGGNQWRQSVVMLKDWVETQSEVKNLWVGIVNSFWSNYQGEVFIKVLLIILGYLISSITLYENSLVGGKEGKSLNKKLNCFSFRLHFELLLTKFLNFTLMFYRVITDSKDMNWSKDLDIMYPISLLYNKNIHVRFRSERLKRNSGW